MTQKEPWGVTLAALARRGTTAEIVVTGHGQRAVIQLERGRVVEVTSRATADSILRIALIHQLILPLQVYVLERQLAAAPDRDELEVMKMALRLSEAAAARFQTHVLAHRIARTFAFEHRSIEIHDARPGVFPRPGIEVCAPIYVGARTYLSDDQLRETVRRLGKYFVLHADVAATSYGFGADEQPVLDELARGAPLFDLEERGGDPRMTYAMVYALASCRDVDALDRGRVVTADNPLTSGLARGTRDDVRSALVEHRIAADACAHRADWALRNNQPAEALAEIARAIELDGETVDYRATQTWARFCAASDKRAIAGEVRSMLTKVARLSHRPELARFYLGRVERILGRVREALMHFRQVLEIEPGHADAAAEIRMLEPRMTSDRRR